MSALQSYEAEMIDQGFRAVEALLKQMRQVHSERKIESVMRAISLQTIDLFPAQFKKQSCNISNRSGAPVWAIRNVPVQRSDQVRRCRCVKG